MTREELSRCAHLWCFNYNFFIFRIDKQAGEKRR